MAWQNQTGIGRNNFDFVRFILAVAVILSHSFALLEGSQHEPLMHITRGQMSLGDLAVDWFFVISGFLIAHSWLRSKSTLEYMKKRVLRIYPGFIGAVLFCVLIVAPLASPPGYHYFRHVKPLQVVGQTATLRFHESKTTFPHNRSHAIDGSLWSIPVEFWCYIGVALLGLAGWLRKPLVILFSLVGALLISLVFVIHHWNPRLGAVFHALFGWSSIWARMLPYYMAGVTFYLFRNQIPFSRILSAACVILFVVASEIPTWGISLLLPVAGTYLLFWFAFEPKIRLENWARHGDFSYGIYVFAFPIQQLLIMEFRPHLSPLFLFALATPLCVLAGALSWYTVERRFLKLKKSHLIHKTVPSASEAQLFPASGG